MSRSTWKGPFSEIKLPSSTFSRFARSSRSERSESRSTFNLKIWSRRSMILPIHLEKNFQVYNGKRFVRLKVSEDMIGHKFGEFALTRRRPIHKINKTRQVIKRKK